MKTFLFILITMLAVSSFESCYYDKAELLYPGSKLPCDTITVPRFSTDVLPVMNANCNASGCHNTASASSGVILDTYDGIKTQVINGQLMSSTGTNGSMPKGAAKLSSCTLTRIQKWIDSGTPNN